MKGPDHDRTIEPSPVAGPRIRLTLLAGCTPSSQIGHGGQSFPLVNPSFMALPVQPMLCNTEKVGYCPGKKPGELDNTPLAFTILPIRLAPQDRVVSRRFGPGSQTIDGNGLIALIGALLAIAIMYRMIRARRSTRAGAYYVPM
jgi:hypothetical protein